MGQIEGAWDQSTIALNMTPFDDRQTRRTDMVRLGKPWNTETIEHSDLDALAGHIARARAEGRLTLDSKLRPLVPERGYAVSVSEHEVRIAPLSALTDEELAVIVLDYQKERVAQEPFVNVGLRFDEDTLVLDRTAIVDTLREAVGYALLEEQEAIYDFWTREVWPTDQAVHYALKTKGDR